MPWCPKCKIEYIEEMTVCNDCGTELIEELPQELFPFMETEKEKFAQKFVQFLHYSDIPSAICEYDAEKEVWIVKVEKSSVSNVKKLYNAFYSVELDQQLSVMGENTTDSLETEEDNEDSFEYSDSEEDPFEANGSDADDSLFDKEEISEVLENSMKKPVKTVTYVRKEEQYRDLKSTAYTFLFVSIVGIAVLILNIVGVIQIFNGILPYIVMGLLFIIFLGIGFQSLFSSKKIQTQVAEENQVTEAINNWLSQSVTLELLDSLTSEETSEEIQFFKKLEMMKKMIIEHFGELDDSYLDLLVEEFYNNNFEH